MPKSGYTVAVPRFHHQSKKRWIVAILVSVVMHAAILLMDRTADHDVKPAFDTVEMMVLGSRDNARVAQVEELRHEIPDETPHDAALAEPKPVAPVEKRRRTIKTGKASGRVLEVVQGRDPGPGGEGLTGGQAAEAAAEQASRKSEKLNADLKKGLDWKGFDSLFATGAPTDSGSENDNGRHAGAGRFQFGKFASRVRLALRQKSSWMMSDNAVPLGNRQLSFDEYIAAVNAQILPRFQSFLDSQGSANGKLHRRIQNSPMKYNPFYSVPLPTAPQAVPSHSLFRDLTLKTVAEVEILHTGALGEVHVVRNSGDSVFDAITVKIILQSAPFPPPPKDIRSWNNRTYLRFAFYRNPSRSRQQTGRGVLLTTPEGQTADYVEDNRIIAD